MAHRFDVNNNPVVEEDPPIYTRMRLRSRCNGEQCYCTGDALHKRPREKSLSKSLSKKSKKSTVDQSLSQSSVIVKSKVVEDLDKRHSRRSRSKENSSATAAVVTKVFENNRSITSLNNSDSIHQRYLNYFNLSWEKKDAAKTDYTYAHSFSYSSLVSYKDRFNWIVPNMSRQSISHSRALLEKESVLRKYDQHVPYSKLQSNETKILTRGKKSINSFQLDDDMHSTPLKKSNDVSIKKQSRIEYSDDDEENASNEHNQTVQHVYNRRNLTKNTNGTFDNEENSEAEDEEEYTIIRRINRFFITTVRNILPGLASEEADIDANSAAARMNYLNNSRNVTHTMRRQNGHYRSAGNRNQKKTSRRLLCFWLPFFFLTALSSAFLYIWYMDGNFNKVSSLLDFSKSSPYSAARFIPSLDLFPRSGEMNNADVSRVGAELQALKNELMLLKSKQESNSYQQQSATPPRPNSGLDFDEIIARINSLEAQLTTCCQSKRIDTIEKNIHDTIDNKIISIQQKYDQQMQKEIAKIKDHLIAFVHDQTANVSGSSGNSNGTSVIDTSYVERLIKNAISKYDADKTGEADFALESSGAYIISTRCSETYEHYSASYKLLGFTLWRTTCTPRVVIQSGVVPGECWCFRGAEGRTAIHLSARIIPAAFTYEHIPRALSRDGHILSAPAKFAVYGMKTDDDMEPELLGEYVYDISSEPMQRFEVQNIETSLHTFDRIELVIKSNHGHSEYTCLYRFRVHGTPVPNGQT